MPSLRFLTFLGVVATAIGLMTAFVELRLVREPGWREPWNGLARWTLRVLAAVAVVTLVFFIHLHRDVGGLAWPGLVWFGCLFLTFTTLALFEIPRRVVMRKHRRDGEIVDLGRRRLLSRTLGGAAALVAGSASGMAVFEATRRVGIVRVRVPIERLPWPMVGLRIVQLSDLHLGPTLGREWTQEVVDTVNALSPDVVAITGDLVDGEVDQLADNVAPLGEIRARHGAFVVTGNHEYYSGVDEWCAHFESLGLQVLRNRRVEIVREGAAIDLAGIDDYGAAMYRRHRGLEGGADLPGALEGRDPHRVLLLLAHQPRHLTEAVEAGVDLQLSGHTHGGQIWPFGFLVGLVQPVVAGLERRGRTWIYVNSGTGFWGPPMRLGAPAEVTLIELAGGVST